MIRASNTASQPLTASLRPIRREVAVPIRSALAVSVLLAAFLPQANQPRRAVDLEAADCSGHQSSWSGLRTAYGTQRTSVPAGGTLDVRPEDNGGVQVVHGKGSTYAITACIAAGARTIEEAQRAVAAVRIVVEGSHVTKTGGGADQKASVQLIIEAPGDAHIQARTANGPIGFEDVAGTFTADASNGPISLRNVRGTATVRAHNGPISIQGSAGTIDAQASNGPIDVTLEGTEWNGKLDARSVNGPLSVTVPDGFRSGVEISSSSHSPWSCRLAECRSISGDRDYDSGRTLRLGRDPITVRVSTNNGPVAVQ
jgi:hypothetical protein